MNKSWTARLASLPRPAFFLLLSLALFMTVIMQLVGAPLTTAAAPAGIVSFEFARDLEGVARILGSWNQQARLHAALSLGLDYVYLLLYAPAIGIACLKAALSWDEKRPGLARVGRWLGWGQGLAALFDSIENLALIRLLLGSSALLWPSLAWIAAILKFGLVLAGLAYALLSPALHLVLPSGDRN